MIHSILSANLGILLTTALTLSSGSTTKEISSPYRLADITAASITVPAVQQPRLPPRGAADHDLSPARVVVRPVGSFGGLGSAEVEVLRAGRVVAMGSAYEPITVPGGSPVDLRVRVTSLIDQPTVEVHGLALTPSEGASMEVPVEVSTGLVRVVARVDGRRVAGAASFYRIEDGHVSAIPCASVGATGASVELSAGRYQVRFTSSGRTLIGEVNLTAGSIRSVSLSS